MKEMREPAMTRRPGAGLTVRTGLVGIAGLVLAGCSSGTHDSGAVSSSPTRAAPSRPAARSSPAAPTAADGTNLSACKDGRCEVEVTHPVKIPIDRRRFKVDLVRVKSIKDDEISFSISTLPPSTLGCNGDDNCHTRVAFGTPDTGRVTAHAGAVVTANRIAIRVMSVGNGSAILRLQPA